MPALESTSLTGPERLVVEHLVVLLEEELGPKLHGVWLYGSRARGEPPRPESDIDILVIAERLGAEHGLRLRMLVEQAAEPVGISPSGISLHLYDPELVAQRRAIRSFFIQEVDRDKIVLAGNP